jgi:hypothetical protein
MLHAENINGNTDPATEYTNEDAAPVTEYINEDATLGSVVMRFSTKA